MCVHLLFDHQPRFISKFPYKHNLLKLRPLGKEPHLLKLFRSRSESIVMILFYLFIYYYYIIYCNAFVFL